MPATVTEKYRRLARTGATVASAWTMVGNVPHAQLMTSIRLMGEHVIPALRDVHPPDGLLQELAAAPAPPALEVAQPPVPT